MQAMNSISPIHHIHARLLELDDALVLAARRFGTPLYAYDLPTFLESWDLLKSALPEGTTLFYSVKANPNVSLLKALKNKGASFEVASDGEIKASLSIGIEAEKLLFVGPGKQQQELLDAKAAGIGILVAESHMEVRRIEELASSSPHRRTSVAVRINPGPSSGRISMGGNTPFGMTPTEALAVLREKHPAIDIIGIHGYLGTDLLNWEDIVSHTQLLLSSARELQKATAKSFRFVDLGGGFGIPYYHKDQSLDIQRLGQELDILFRHYRRDYPETILAMESGRFVAGPCGVFLCTVIDVKDIGDRRFAVLDGGKHAFGLADRYLGHRTLPFRVLDCRGLPSCKPVTLVGPLCTPADRLAVDQRMPLPQPGSIIAFYQAGAYGLTASPGLFLGHGFPCEVLLDHGRMGLARRRLGMDSLLPGQPTTIIWENAE